MHAAQNPPKLPSTPELELFVKLISTLPTWASAVIVIVLITVVGAAWAAPRLLRALAYHRSVNKAWGHVTTEAGALEALRITQAAPQGHLSLGKPQAGDQSVPPAQADK